MHWHFFFRLQGRKTASLKPGLLDQNFSFLRKLVALVFAIFAAKQTKIIAHANRVNHRTTASFKIAVCQVT